MTGLHIKPDGTISTFVFDSSDIAEKVHILVDGYFEAVPQNSITRVTMYANEDGKRHNLPVNPLATIISGLFPQDWVVGNVVLVGAPNEAGDDQGLTTEVIQAVLSIDIERTWIELNIEALTERGPST